MNSDELGKFHAGDGETFAMIIASLKGQLRRQIAKRSGIDRDEADDLYSEVCERIFERRREYRGDGPFAGWAYSLCERICADHFRRKALAIRHAKPFNTPMEISTQSGSEDDRRTRAEHLQSVEDAIADTIHTLPPRMRAMMIANVYLNETAAEIAGHFHVKASSVWTTLSQGRKLLRDRLLPVMRQRSKTPA